MFDNINEFAEQLRKQHGSALLNKHATAKELSVSRATLDRMRQSGLIKSQRVGQQVRFNVLEIARIIIGGQS